MAAVKTAKSDAIQNNYFYSSIGIEKERIIYLKFI